MRVEEVGIDAWVQKWTFTDERKKILLMPDTIIFCTV